MPRPPSSSTVTVRHEVIPTSDRREAMRVWRDSVASHGYHVVVGPVAIEVDAGSVIVTSNRSPDEWLATFADPVRAQSTIDRTS